MSTKLTLNTAGIKRSGLFKQTALVASIMLLATTSAFAQQKLRPVTIGVGSSGLIVGSVRIAKELGLYEKHGLDPVFTIMETGNAAVSALIGRSVEVVAATSSDLIAAQARGQKVVMIGNTYGGLAGTMVLTKSAAEKLGVSPTAPAAERFKALSGVVLALPSPTAGFTISLKSAMKTYNTELRSTYIASANMNAALESGAVQGLFISAPFWMQPIIKGNAIVWLSGPNGDFPPDAMPASSTSLQVMRDFAEANPQVVKSLAGVLDDFAKAVKERPNEVKAAMAKVFSNLDQETRDLFFKYESVAWTAKPLTAKDMAHEIEFVKASGADLPGLDKLDPAAMVFP